MARKLALISCFVLMLVLLAEKMQASDLQIEVSQPRGNNQTASDQQIEVSQPRGNNQTASDLQIVVSQPRGNNQTYGVTQGSLRPQECGPRCTGRCSKTAYKKPCMFFCQKCCAKCLCVPPGTYGNKQVCPCYNNWTTKRGGPKCP